MVEMKRQMRVDGHLIEVERKRVKHVNFTVYPPEGRVRVSAPLRLSEEALEEAIRTKLPWIERHKAKMLNEQVPPSMAFRSGEMVDFMGERLCLRVIEGSGRQHAARVDQDLLLHIRPGTTREARQRLLIAWYRAALKRHIPPLIARWEPVIGVRVADWGVKRMKTRWGSCNVQAQRIWLNLALVRYPPTYLEYVVVHEMTHLLERRHNGRFFAFLDHFLPGWEESRRALKAAPTYLWG